MPACLHRQKLKKHTKNYRSILADNLKIDRASEWIDAA
jgi:hypothetical protein